MLSSDRFLLFAQLILLEFHGRPCAEDHSFRTTSHSHNHHHPAMSPFMLIVSVPIDQHFTVLNCSTPEHVPHHKLDWYFQTRSSLSPPRVIWQRGRSNIPRYLAYSPDQTRHFLQIRPLHYNDSGTYMCLDQTSGYSMRMELFVHDSRSCAATAVGLPMTPALICLVLLSLFFSRYTASESQVT